MPGVFPSIKTHLILTITLKPGAMIISFSQIKKKKNRGTSNLMPKVTPFCTLQSQILNVSSLDPKPVALRLKEID